MVKTIQQRMAVYSHPHEKLVKRLIRIEDIDSADARLTAGKANRLMVGDAVSQYVDAVKLIEHESVVILNSRR